MRIVVCVKEVLDPDAVNSYAVAGRLVVGDDGRSLTQTAIPRLMNGFDEQAIEAALRLRDAGIECSITVVSAGGDATKPLRHAAALGADDVASIQLDPSELDPSALDHHVVATLLAAYVRSSGGADLVLCGRQASDDDQGVVPALIGEALKMPVVTVARAIERADVAGEPTLRVTRVTADGDEVVEVSTPAVVTISNELGEPRYPTAANTLRARRVRPVVVSLSDLSLDEAELAPRAVLARQFVPKVEGHCEWVSGDTASEVAERLVARLREDGVLPRAGSQTGQAKTGPGS